MLILAIESSARHASLALLRDDETLLEIELPPTQRTAQSLAPGLKQLFARAGCSARDLDLVAVNMGPGSFTGLRVGVTTAKSIAYATKADVYAVNTLDVIAERAPAHIPQFAAVIDAMRDEYFIKMFRRINDKLESINETQILGVDQIKSEVRFEETSLTGPATDKLVAELAEEGITPQVVDTEHREPRAVELGRLAAQEYRRGKRVDLWSLTPEYFRKSAAEEKLG